MEIGHHVSAGAEVEVSPTEGHDPSGPIIDVKATVDVQVHPATEGPSIEAKVSDHMQAGIETSRPGLDGLSTSTHDQLGGIDDE